MVSLAACVASFIEETFGSREGQQLTDAGADIGQANRGIGFHDVPNGKNQAELSRADRRQIAEVQFDCSPGDQVVLLPHKFSEVLFELNRDIEAVRNLFVELQVDSLIVDSNVK